MFNLWAGRFTFAAFQRQLERERTHRLDFDNHAFVAFDHQTVGVAGQVVPEWPQIAFDLGLEVGPQGVKPRLHPFVHGVSDVESQQSLVGHTLTFGHPGHFESELPGAVVSGRSAERSPASCGSRPFAFPFFAQEAVKGRLDDAF
jgi:hypothetical protein